MGIINSVVLTAGVFAAIITSVVNIIIALMNNSKLNKIEQKKKMNEIDRYRYTHLYELLLSWQNYSSEISGNTPSEMANCRLMNSFLDDVRRFDIARPLLDKKYVEMLQIKSDKGYSILNRLIDLETNEGIHLEGFSEVKKQFISFSIEFTGMLKKSIYSQIEELIEKNG